MVHTETHHRSRATHAIRGVALSVVTAFLALGIFLGVFYGAIGIRSYIEDLISGKLLESLVRSTPVEVPQGVTMAEPPLPDNTTPAPVESLAYLSFTDLFSGFGWLNQASTTLAHDQSATAFHLPALVEWKRIDGPAVSVSPYVVVTPESGAIQGISVSGTYVPLPKSFTGKTVTSVSAAPIGSRWAVGVVVQNGSLYEASVYVLGSGGLEPAFASFSSPYVGVFGFGGSDGNWLAVYGAYDGVAYHVKNGRAEDVSRFFGTRIEAGGFRPSVVRTGDGWLVYGVSAGTVRIVKLFENGTGSIRGEVDVSPSAPFGDATTLKISDAGGETFFVEAGRVSGTERWEMRDRGFDVSKSYELVSLNLLGYPAETRYAGVTEALYDAGGGTVSFFISTDGENWKPVSVGSIGEISSSGTKLFWRVLVVPDATHPAYSPYLDQVRLDFRVRVGG